MVQVRSRVGTYCVVKGISEDRGALTTRYGHSPATVTPHTRETCTARTSYTWLANAVVS